jgi:hypothetical protein
MWDTFAFDCFDFKVRPGTPATNPGLYRQSNLKSPQTTCYCNFFYPTIQCLQRAPGRRVTEKSHFPTLNVGLAGTGTGNRIQATCLAGSVARSSAIHYAYTQGFQKLYLDPLKVLKSFFNFLFLRFYIFCCIADILKRGCFWGLSTFRHLGIYIKFETFPTYVLSLLLERRMPVQMGLIRAHLAYG